MPAPAASEAQIRATVIDLTQRYPDERVFGIRTEPRWTGAEVFHLEHRPVRVVCCPSSLAAREALIDVEDRAERLVLLIDRPERDLGDDVMARLARRRLFPVDPWETLRGLFKAQNIDPRLADQADVATALIEAVPVEGFPAAPAAFLTAELAWGTLLERRLELPREPTLGDLLTWAEREPAVRLWEGLSPGLRAGIRRRLSELLGPAASAVLSLVEAAQAPDALPLGLVLGILFSDEPDGLQDRLLARVRLEGALSGALPPGAAIAWSRESERLLRERVLASNGSVGRDQLMRAERLLADLGAPAHAHLSDLVESGFDQRLATLAAAAERCAAGEPADDLAAALATVERHVTARLDPQRLRAGQMAARLARWLAGPGASPWIPASFADAAAAHTSELAFVDWARRLLWPGDRAGPVNAVYLRLTQGADRARADRDRRFAALLAGWLEAGATSKGLVLLERALDEVVAPLAAREPVLLLVADGMSVDVAHELVGEMVRRGWTELAPEDATGALTGVACLPTVTEVCRTSLLSGQLTAGDAGREGRRFAAHPALLAASTPNSPPVLFHRADLTSQGAQTLPDAVQTVVQDPRQRVVGVVVNAVDDLLMKGGQLAPLWAPDAIPVLAALLEAARDAGRVVVLMSDHGHIVDRGTTYRPNDGGGGERWRVATDPPGEDEVLLTGARVLLGQGRVVAASTEWIRYSTSRRDGYHGGATPREAVVPLRVLRAPFAGQPAGWREIPTTVPDWWDGSLRQLDGTGGTAGARRAGPAGQQSLFDPQPAADTPAVAAEWIQALLGSDVYRQQSERLGARARVEDERLAAILAALDARGGTSTRAALARAAQVPEARIDGVLSAMRRVLNVDGYPVLSTTPDGETVVVNVGLLRTQFGL